MSEIEDTLDEAKLNLLPPYPAFQSVKSGIALLKEHVIPNRIDRSIWGNKYSGSVATQVLTAFRFLGLVSNDGTPTQRLRSLVDALNTEKWPEQLERVLRAAYAPIFELDLQKVTVTQFFERFRDVYKAEGDTARKCVTFFLNAAREAEIPVSPFLTSGSKPRGSSSPKRRVKMVRFPDGNKTEPPEPPSPPTPPPADTLTERLLEKFPELDPSWPDDIKAKWFASFSELMDRTKK